MEETPNRGAQLLGRWLKKSGVTQKAFARTIKRDQGAVSKWVNAKAIPNYPGRVACRKIAGIPEDAWDKRAR